jgi:GNAT superfamily N-acetyltransferase
MAATPRPASQEAGLPITQFHPSDRDGVLSLLGQGRSADYQGLKRRVFDWQFLSNPDRTDLPPFVVVKDDDQVVGALGLMPMRARVNGRSPTACWVMDIFVDSAHRGRGWGQTLIRHATFAGLSMLVFGISDMSDPIFAEQGWALDTTVQTLFLHVAEPGLKGVVKNLASRCKAWWAGRRAPREAARVELSTQPPQAAEIDELWARLTPQYPNAVVRDASHLMWRYRDAPVLHYQWVQARQNEALQALLITRHAPHESVVVDYLGPLDRPGLLRTLLDAAVQDLSAAGTRRIRCECNHPGMQQALSTLGFRRYRSEGRFRIKLGDPDAPSDDRLSGPWFLMTGDSDNDMLDLHRPLA